MRQNTKRASSIHFALYRCSPTSGNSLTHITELFGGGHVCRSKHNKEQSKSIISNLQLYLDSDV